MNIMLGKVKQIWGKKDFFFWGGGGGGCGQRGGEQLEKLAGLVGQPSEVPARTVGDGLNKMMKKREGER